MISQLRGDKEYDVKQKDKKDWREMSYGDKDLWKNAIADLEGTPKVRYQN